MTDQQPADVPRWKTILGIALVIGAIAAAISMIVRVIDLVAK